MKINNSNEWGHLFYSFHTNVACVALADGSIRTLSEGMRLRIIADMVTRSGGEVPLE